MPKLSRTMLAAAGLLLGAAPAPPEAATAEARLVVTARVVNRCTIDVPARPPAHAAAWQHWVHHRCDLPVRPRLTVGRLDGAAAPSVARAGSGGHVVITITY